MKQFLEDYGFAIVVTIVVITIIAMTTPIGNTIKSQVLNTVNTFAAVVDNKFNENPSANPYRNKALSAQRLYDIGEWNLTEDDIVYVNGVECYVLEVSPDNSKAKLITKDIYDVRFDDSDYNIGNKTNIGSGPWANITCNYSQSYLMKYMNDFYNVQLGQDEKIITNTSITVYYSESEPHDKYDFNSYETVILNNQPVFALDAIEANKHKDKFKWNYDKNYNCGFWVTAGFKVGGDVFPFFIYYYRNALSFSNVSHEHFGARPVFWLSLE